MKSVDVRIKSLVLVERVPLKNRYGFMLTYRRRLKVSLAGKVEAPVMSVAPALHFPFSAGSFQCEVPSAECLLKVQSLSLRF